MSQILTDYSVMKAALSIDAEDWYHSIIPIAI